jgi:hypothetical protein
MIGLCMYVAGISISISGPGHVYAYHYGSIINYNWDRNI